MSADKSMVSPFFMVSLLTKFFPLYHTPVDFSILCEGTAAPFPEPVKNITPL
jgi:hypothetical protein